MIGYKVIRDCNSQSLSAFSSKVVVYKEGEWVSHPSLCGPLCLFSNVNAATHFINTVFRNYDFVSLWEVEYAPSKMDYIHTFGVNKIFLDELIGGTVLADKVKLLKQIWVNDGLLWLNGNWVQGYKTTKLA